MRRLTAAFALLLLPCLASCGEEQMPGARVFDASETSTPDAEGPYAAPPPIRVYAGGKEFDAWRGSYCWKHACPWIAPPEAGAVPEAGSPDLIEFSFPVAETQFSARFMPIGDKCRPGYDGTVVDLGDGRYALEPGGPAGRYEVTLRGAAPEGEVFDTFLWTTPLDGPLVEPEAEISIVGKRDGMIEPQGFLLNLRDVAKTPRTASVRVTVTAGNGAKTTIEVDDPERGCPLDGYVSFWDYGPIARQVVDLGPEPFRYDVEMVLDGSTYSASAIWPDDLVEEPAGNDPGTVPLVFDPPLPSRE